MKSKKVTKKIIITFFLLIILYFLFGGDYNIYNLLKYRQQAKELQVQIQESKNEKKTLKVEIEKLKSDSTYIEKIAREEYKMGKPGEKIYVVKSKDE